VGLVPDRQPLTTYVPAEARYTGCECNVEDSEALGVPVIGVPCEVYSRIVGYLRPVSAWNDAKQGEFEDRQTFKVTEI